jgi:hypothetical protein
MMKPQHIRHVFFRYINRIEKQGDIHRMNELKQLDAPFTENPFDGIRIPHCHVILRSG